MSKAPGWGGGPWALVVELSVLCPWVCFNKSSQIYIYIYIYIYTWIFENRVNESFMFFQVVLILRLSLKDTVSKLRFKEVFLFMSAVFLHLLQQLVA